MAGASGTLKLGLGTVQFGLDYGISNRGGQVGQSTAREILGFARKAGVDLLDTASAYGDSEAVLGRCEVAREGFQLVTKLPPVPTALAEREVGGWVRELFDQSCTRLAASAMYGLMTHRAADLLEPKGARLWQEMQALKSDGRVQRIGASVYEGAEVDALLQDYELGLIQLPINVLDQRLLQSGRLDRLKTQGVEVHARSLLLQGLLTLEAEQLPAHFSPLRSTLLQLTQDAKALGLTCLQAALRFGSTLPQIDRMIVGVTSVGELEQVIDAVNGPALADYGRYAISDDALLNPARWPSGR